jgi:hypothetical protein
MGSVHARGDTFLTFGLKALTVTNTSRLATGPNSSIRIYNGDDDDVMQKVFIFPFLNLTFYRC